MQKLSLSIFIGVVTLANSISNAQDCAPIIQTQFPTIILQPLDQYAPIGSKASFAVAAENADGYQWLRNGNVIDSQTNSVLVITKAGISDVSYYSCEIFKGTQFVPTRAASLMVYSNSIDPQTGVDPVVVYSYPLASNGSQSSCPGRYVGYVNYSPGGNAWGWTPDVTNGNTIFTAMDTNRSNTKIQYVGEYGDMGCNQTSVTLPAQPFSPAYVFAIYFTNNVPTNAYPITLDGFNP